MSWNEAGADPSADIAAMMARIPEASEGIKVMVIPHHAYIELRLSAMDFGWWPMSVFRRQGARAAMAQTMGGDQ